ncbi:hypothetical protein Bca4012_083698 [Brassica carinata]
MNMPSQKRLRQLTSYAPAKLLEYKLTKGGAIDNAQINPRETLLSQIRDSVVVLWDRIHKELGNQKDLIRMIKLD